jgi:hypothetical protein
MRGAGSGQGSGGRSETDVSLREGKKVRKEEITCKYRRFKNKFQFLLDKLAPGVYI